MNLIIVHGEKSTSGGRMHPAFKSRLDACISIIKEKPVELIIITGGQTRKNVPTEAKLGFEYLKNKFNTPILLEEKARTTSENIRYSKVLVGHKSLEKIIVISSKKRMFRLKYLYWRLWPEVYSKIRFIKTKDFYSIFFYPLEFFYLIFAIIDPREKLFARFTKKVFRST